MEANEPGRTGTSGVIPICLHSFLIFEMLTSHSTCDRCNVACEEPSGGLCSTRHIDCIMYCVVFGVRWRQTNWSLHTWTELEGGFPPIRFATEHRLLRVIYRSLCGTLLNAVFARFDEQVSNDRFVFVSWAVNVGMQFVKQSEIILGYTFLNIKRGLCVV